MVAQYLGHAGQFKSVILPFFTPSVSAGFPSPAQDHHEENLDIKNLLVKHPAATFFVRAAGDSMIGAGIHSGDILVVDRSLRPSRGRIVIAVLNGELTVKKLAGEKSRPQLQPENPNYLPIDVTEETDLRIWGVVTSVIHLF